MQTVFLAASAAVLSIILSPAPYAFAQDAQVARGLVTTIGGHALTVKVRDHELTFAIDSTTSIEAPGAGTKQRAAVAAGKSGPTLADVVKVGQPVAVTYYEINGAMHASKVRAVGNVASHAAATSGEAHGNVALGSVKEIGDRSLTITGNSGGGAIFTQTFAIDERTHVFAKGGGTAARANGGRVPFNQLIASGDLVSVSYDEIGGALHAADVRVTRKGAR